MNEPTDDLLARLSRESGIFERAEGRAHLIAIINDLLLHDFNRLISILYRVDVNEQKLKSLLQENPGTDAAMIIADLLIQRQEEKLRSRENGAKSDDIPEEEKW